MKARPRTAPNSPENGTLTPRQEGAALALARGLSLPDAARESRAGVRTIKSWTASLPAFSRRVQQLRSEMTGRALGKLADNMASAADTLGYLARKAKSETIRLGASRAILELGVKFRESTELAERITALESRQ